MFSSINERLAGMSKGLNDFVGDKFIGKDGKDLKMASVERKQMERMKGELFEKHNIDWNFIPHFESYFNNNEEYNVILTKILKEYRTNLEKSVLSNDIPGLVNMFPNLQQDVIIKAYNSNHNSKYTKEEIMNSTITDLEKLNSSSRNFLGNLNDGLAKMSKGINDAIDKKAVVKRKLSEYHINFNNIDNFDSYFEDKSKSVDDIVNIIREYYNRLYEKRLEHNLDNSEKRDQAFETVKKEFPDADYHHIISELLQQNDNNASKVIEFLNPSSNSTVQTGDVKSISSSASKSGSPKYAAYDKVYLKDDTNMHLYKIISVNNDGTYTVESQNSSSSTHFNINAADIASKADSTSSSAIPSTSSSAIPSTRPSTTIPSTHLPPVEDFITMFENLDKQKVIEVYNRNNKMNENPTTIENTIVTELLEIPPPNTDEANLKILYEFLYEIGIDIDKDIDKVKHVYENHKNDLNQAATELLSQYQSQSQSQVQVQAPVGIFAERQEGLLCAKHAINNLLQEEKFITGKNIKNNGKNPLIIGEKLSFTDYCKTFGNRIDPGGTGHPVCRPNGGEMEINGVQLLLKDILGYRIDYRPLRDQEAIINLQKQKCIGAILRTQEAGGHYVAISKINKQYVLIDSLGLRGPRVEPYVDMPSLITNLRDRLKDVITVIYVYDQLNAYESVTANYIRKTWKSSRYNEKTFLILTNLETAENVIMKNMKNDVFKTLRIHINITYPSEYDNNPPFKKFLSERNIHTLPELIDAVNDFYEGLFIKDPNANPNPNANANANPNPNANPNANPMNVRPMSQPDKDLQKYIEINKLKDVYGDNATINNFLSKMKEVKKCLDDNNSKDLHRTLHRTTEAIINILENNQQSFQLMFNLLKTIIEECQNALGSNEPNFFQLCDAMCKSMAPSSSSSPSSSPSSSLSSSPSSSSPSSSLSSSPNLSTPLTQNLVKTVSKYFKNRFDDILNKAAQQSRTVGDFVNNIFANKSISNDKMKKIFFIILAVIFTVGYVKQKYKGGGSTDVQTIENLLKQLGVSENTINEFEKKVKAKKNADVIKFIEGIKGGRPTRKRLFRHKTRHTVNRL